ncbi:MAG TPA: hypothetical protein VJL33_03495 [Candidatus Bathyarchaeia archaeon]|nr:hypothetical protein [Candidatus Bathyarchaeia archaeon]
MFEQTQNVEELGKSIYKTIEELEQEKKRLYDEKANLLDIEAKLQARVGEEVDIRKQENQELKTEIEDLKRRCEELTQFLNNRRQD